MDNVNSSVLHALINHIIKSRCILFLLNSFKENVLQLLSTTSVWIISKDQLIKHKVIANNSVVDDIIEAFFFSFKVTCKMVINVTQMIKLIYITTYERNH